MSDGLINGQITVPELLCKADFSVLHDHTAAYRGRILYTALTF